MATSATLGTKRGRGRGAFIDSVLGAIDSFYAEVLGDLKAWSAAPPKMRQVSPAELVDIEPTRPASLASTDFSSQDGTADAVTGAPDLAAPQASPDDTAREDADEGASTAAPIGRA